MRLERHAFVRYMVNYGKLRHILLQASAINPPLPLEPENRPRGFSGSRAGPLLSPSRGGGGGGGAEPAFTAVPYGFSVQQPGTIRHKTNAAENYFMTSGH